MSRRSGKENHWAMPSHPELFSTSSSLSDEEVELSRKKKRNIRLSTHYSTSDLTTSDSSIGHFISHRRFLLNPDLPLNSSISLEDSSSIQRDEDEEEEEEESEEILPHPPDLSDDQDLPPQIRPLRFDAPPPTFPLTNPQTSSRRAHRSLFESKIIRPEEYGLPGHIAKQYGVNGILFLTIAICRRSGVYSLDISLRNGIFFVGRELSSQLEVEFRGNKRHRKGSHRHRSLSEWIPTSTQPDYRFHVRFPIDSEDSKRDLRISVLTRDSIQRELFGRMTFGLRRLWKKAQEIRRFENRSVDDVKTKVCEDGYFLMNEYYGRFNLPRKKIRHYKYYDEISSNTGPKGMADSEFRTVNFGETRRHSVQMGSRNCRAISARLERPEIFVHSVGSSTSSSSDGYRSRHRFTLPTIVANTSDDEEIKLRQREMSISNQLARPSISGELNGHQTVRRVSSFTHSDERSINKPHRKWSAISKLGNLFRKEKFPSKSEIRKWRDGGFETLMNGRSLFRQFVLSECSSENLDFYEAVDEFRRLDPKKGQNIQKATEIFDTFFRENAPKELNLDSTTKNGTRKRLEAGAPSDTFDAAQCVIGHLMAKDTYGRFIKSRLFLDILGES